MKIVILFCTLATSLVLSEDLKEILKSPQATLNLYNSFKSHQGVRYGSSEDRLRFGLFRDNARFVAEANSANDDSASYQLNFFSTLTHEEQGAYLGLNATGRVANPPGSALTSDNTAPDSMMWVNREVVTPVKSQGACGSSWSFSVVGAVETRYALLSGRLRDLAEQEFLDCVYWFNGGCDGGWMSDAYDWAIEMDGTLAATSEYPYTGKDRWCKVSDTHNALRSHRITRAVSVPQDEAANIAALSHGSLSVALEVTDHFKFYLNGILRDTTCSGEVNHGAVAVGYTPEFVLVKNSWSSTWGDQGFVKLARGHHNCGLWTRSSYPEFKKTERSDRGVADPATDYRVEEEEPTSTPEPSTPQPSTPEPSTPAPSPAPSPIMECIDKATNCERDSLCQYPSLAETWCAKHCKYCESEPTPVPNPEPNPNPTPTPAPLCYDKATNCVRDDLCQHAYLAETWCRKHCGYCQDPETQSELPAGPEPTPEPYTPEPAPGPVPVDECFDYATNCARDNLCRYPSLAETWCAKHCKYCESEEDVTPDPVPLCFDLATNCVRDNLCQYPSLAESWCRKQCGYCQES